MAERMNRHSSDSALHNAPMPGIHQRLVEEQKRLSAARPILQFLMANQDRAMFSDEVIATLRGMISHLARQLLQELAIEDADPSAFVAEHEETLCQLIASDGAFLDHAHAFALEGRFTERLLRQSEIDPVLTPLLKELAASPDADKAQDAMHLMASQARFVQQMRRMELPLTELPAEIYHRLLLAMRKVATSKQQALRAETHLRETYDEAASRLGQLTKRALTLAEEMPAKLAIQDFGFAIFATRLAMASGQDRVSVILSMSNNQITRFAGIARLAGLKEQQVYEQLLFLHPEKTGDTDLSGLERLGRSDLIELLGSRAEG